MNFREIERLVNRAAKEIEAAKVNLDIDEGIAYTTAYTSMLHVGRALMCLKKFRPADGQQHKTTVEFASHILGNKYKKLIRYFDKMRKKRNIFTYEVTISISKSECRNAIDKASEFIKVVLNKIKQENPQIEFDF